MKVCKKLRLEDDIFIVTNITNITLQFIFNDGYEDFSACAKK